MTQACTTPKSGPTTCNARQRKRSGRAQRQRAPFDVALAGEDGFCEELVGVIRRVDTKRRLRHPTDAVRGGRTQRFQLAREALDVVSPILKLGLRGARVSMGACLHVNHSQATRAFCAAVIVTSCACGCGCCGCDGGGGGGCGSGPGLLAGCGGCADSVGAALLSFGFAVSAPFAVGFFPVRDGVGCGGGGGGGCGGGGAGLLAGCGGCADGVDAAGFLDCLAVFAGFSVVVAPLRDGGGVVLAASGAYARRAAARWARVITPNPNKATTTSAPRAQRTGGGSATSGEPPAVRRVERRGVPPGAGLDEPGGAVMGVSLGFATAPAPATGPVAAVCLLNAG